MGPGQKFLTWVRSGLFFVARVGSLLVWVWVLKISLKDSKFFPLGQKNLFESGQKVTRSKTGQPLIYCESKVCSGRVISNHTQVPEHGLEVKNHNILCPKQSTYSFLLFLLK